MSFESIQEFEETVFGKLADAGFVDAQLDWTNEPDPKADLINLADTAPTIEQANHLLNFMMKEKVESRQNKNGTFTHTFGETN